jgi:hypothetical protein
MPFDSMYHGTWVQSDLTVTSPLVWNTLAAIGIIPVPMADVDRHKAQVTACYRALSLHHAQMVADGRARWQTHWIKSIGAFDPDEVDYPPFAIIRKRLAKWPDHFQTPDQSPAPRAIIKVAERVHEKITGASFGVAYFYNDPILLVNYTDANRCQHTECLGIWDNGKVVALAVMPPRRSWLKRLFSLPE